MNIFSEQYTSETRDGELVTLAQQGNRTALEELILRHQSWIYNIAFRMVGNPHDALELRAQKVFQEHPFQESPDYVHMLKDMLNCGEFQEFINFN